VVVVAESAFEGVVILDAGIPSSGVGSAASSGFIQVELVFALGAVFGVQLESETVGRFGVGFQSGFANIIFVVSG